MNKKREQLITFGVDFFTINLSFIVFFLLRTQTGLFELLIMPEFLIPMFIIFLYWLIIFMFVGMYRTWFAASRFDEITILFKSTFVGIFILFALIFLDDYIHNIDSKSRILIFIYWGIFLLFVSTGRILIRSVQRNLLINGIGRKNSLIVGFNKKANEVHDQLIEYKALGLDVVAYIAIREENLGKEYRSIKVIDYVKNIRSVIDRDNIKEVIIAMDKEDHEFLVELMAECENSNVGLKIVPNLYEILSGQARTTQIYGMPLIDIMPQLMP